MTGRIVMSLLCATGLALGTGGCARQKPAEAAAGHEGEHSHTAQFGGMIQQVGDLHMELVVEEGRRLRCYVLGPQVSLLWPLPERSLAAQVQARGADSFYPVELKASPQPGEPPGEASQFVADVPDECAGRPLNVIVTLPVYGRRYRARFETGQREEHASMPVSRLPSGGAAESEIERAERELYQTPGGVYTAADIAANGPDLPSRRFAGISARHDMHPKPGDRLCPITGTLANREFPWVVAGETYTFCCPPCIEEFVRMAKEKPDAIKPPESYVKR